MLEQFFKKEAVDAISTAINNERIESISIDITIKTTKDGEDIGNNKVRIIRNSYSIDLMGATPEDARIEAMSDNLAALAGIRNAKRNSVRVYLSNPEQRELFCRECCQVHEQCDCTP